MEKTLKLAPGEAHLGPATPARLPPPTCPHHVCHLLDAVAPPWPRAPLEPSPPSPAPSRHGHAKTTPADTLGNSPTPFLSSSSRHRRGKFLRARRRHDRAPPRPLTSSRLTTLSSVCLAVAFVTERKESSSEPLRRAHGHLPQLRPPRRRGGNPAPPRRHRGRSLHRYVSGELLHHPHVAVEVPVSHS